MKFEQRYYARKRYRLVLSLLVSLYFMFLLLGILGLLILNAEHLNNYFKEQLTITVYFADGTPRKSIKLVEKELKTDTLVKEVIFISKEKAAERARAILGEDFITVLGENPLQDNLEIHLHGRFVTDGIIENFKKRLLQNPRVEDVVYEKTILSVLNRNVKKISTVLLIFSLILLLIIYFTVRNTVRLSVYNRRYVIKTMQLVGAPEGFILRPYVWTYGGLGLLAGGGAALTIWAAAWKLHTLFPAFELIMQKEEFYFLLGGLVVAGFLLSLVTGYLAAKSILRMNPDDIHY
ncbi:MAG: hypothetical protein GXO24_03890 [Chlorobi bacterium]|nr:hypothetical protein [Chlorobiota bacterium]